MNNKKSDIKNRIKGFLRESARNGKNRIKEDEVNPGIQEINDKGKKDNQNPQNPEEECDQS